MKKIVLTIIVTIAILMIIIPIATYAVNNIWIKVPTINSGGTTKEELLKEKKVFEERQNDDNYEKKSLKEEYPVLAEKLEKAMEEAKREEDIIINAINRNYPDKFMEIKDGLYEDNIEERDNSRKVLYEILLDVLINDKELTEEEKLLIKGLLNEQAEDINKINELQVKFQQVME